jgi:hypothetical protein
LLGREVSPVFNEPSGIRTIALRSYLTLGAFFGASFVVFTDCIPPVVVLRLELDRIKRRRNILLANSEEATNVDQPSSKAHL